MKKVVLVLMATLFLLPSAAAANQFLAVIVSGHNDQGVNNVFGVNMTRALVQTGMFRESPRYEEFMNAVNAEQQRDENRIVEIARRFGIQSVCFTTLSPVLGSHYINAKIVSVETGAIMANGNIDGQIATLADIRNMSDTLVGIMTGTVTQPAPMVAQPSPSPQVQTFNQQQQFQQPQVQQFQQPQFQQPQQQVVPMQQMGGQQVMQLQPGQQIVQTADGQFVIVNAAQPVVPMRDNVSHGGYDNFTGAQRFGTGALNWLIPGLGSFAIMRDNRGGLTQVGLWGGGLALFITGVVFADDGEPVMALAFYIAGSACFTGNLAYNIYRSITYDKPTFNAMFGDNTGFDFALFPDRDGNLTAAARYSLEF